MHLITAQEVVGLNPTEVTKGIAEMLFPFLFIVHFIVHFILIYLNLKVVNCNKLNIMKNLLFTLALLVSFNSFSQTSVELNLTSKEYKKISKSLDLKVVNRGYDGSGEVFVKMSKYASDRITLYSKLWNEALFEMGIPTGNISDITDETVFIDADWIIKIDGKIGYNEGGSEITSGGGFSGKIVDFNNDSKIVATFSSRDSMTFIEGFSSGTKRTEKFKNIVKVIFNEILLTIK